MKRPQKSTWLCAILFLYVTATALLLTPKNQEISLLEKSLTIGVSYLAIVLLWFLLRRKERLAAHRREEAEKPKEKE